MILCLRSSEPWSTLCVNTAPGSAVRLWGATEQLNHNLTRFSQSCLWKGRGVPRTHWGTKQKHIALDVFWFSLGLISVLHLMSIIPCAISRSGRPTGSGLLLKAHLLRNAPYSPQVGVGVERTTSSDKEWKRSEKKRSRNRSIQVRTHFTAGIVA